MEIDYYARIKRAPCPVRTTKRKPGKGAFTYKKSGKSCKRQGAFSVFSTAHVKLRELEKDRDLPPHIFVWSHVQET